MTTAEQREHPRYAIELEAEVAFEDMKINGRTSNISRGGFCMASKQPVALGTQCTVQLALVFSENQFSEQLRLTGLVVWSTPYAGQFQLGIKFSSMSALNSEYLELFMRFLEEGEEGDEDEPGDGDDDDDDLEIKVTREGNDQ